jgi:TolA-binding protein
VQFNIGEIHYSQQKLDLAVQDFDAVIERYSDNTKIVPDAYFMKGMALKQSAHSAAAVTTFRALIAKYPHSDKADEARDQLRALNASAAAPGKKKVAH